MVVLLASFCLPFKTTLDKRTPHFPQTAGHTSCLCHPMRYLLQLLFGLMICSLLSPVLLAIPTNLCLPRPCSASHCPTRSGSGFRRGKRLARTCRDSTWSRLAYGENSRNGCGSKLERRGKPQVLVHVSTYQGSILEFQFFEPLPNLFRHLNGG